MDLETAVRTRRTHKVYGAEPVDRATLDELFTLATWAPNHHLTNPWRFRVLGPNALERLKDAVGPEGAKKLDRAPTLVVVSSAKHEDPVQDEEDRDASAVAAYLVLLAAHAKGLASYWRTPGVLRTAAGQAAVGIDGTQEHVLGLIHLGPKRQEQPAPQRTPAAEVTTYLD